MDQSIIATGGTGALPFSLSSDCAAQAYRLLQVAFVLLPIGLGADKFFGDMTNWELYLAPAIASHLNIAPTALIRAVGVIEICTGIVVAAWPRVGAYMLTMWFWAIVIDLLTIQGCFDIAARDIALSLGTLALARLSKQYQNGPVKPSFQSQHGDTITVRSSSTNDPTMRVLRSPGP